jgi:uncharacterized protein YbjT (DUF2867 family)
MSEQLTVLVTGATGQQGGMVARTLKSRGHHVLGLTRNPDSPSARELKDLGIGVTAGDFNDPPSLVTAVQGVDAVYVMATPFEAGTEAEARQGIAAVDAAKTAGVQHLVYSSVSDADRETGIPHFDSKYQVERHIQSQNLPYTIVAPAYFMENLISPFMLPGLKQGTLSMAMPATRELQQISVQDIASFTALVLENRDRFLSKRVNIGGDEVDGARTAEIVSRVSGHQIDYVEADIEELLGANQDLGKMFDWFNQVGYSGDIPALRRDYPEVGWHTLEEWANAQDWGALLR